jgi:hypothetical protein
MPIVPNFTAAQSSGSPNILTLTDTSTGSDVLITQRRVYILQSNGNYLKPSNNSTDYIVWAYAAQSISLDVLTKDTAVTIIVEWLDVSNAVLYSKTISFGFTAYNETFYYGLTQDLIASPNLYQSQNWVYNKMLLRVYLDSGNQAISFASNINAAQINYDLATNLQINKSYFF